MVLILRFNKIKLVVPKSIDVTLLAVEKYNKGWRVKYIKIL